MRLTCPNCSAQYEVDESVIPKAGRDVQCSACGHTWYQYPREVALAMRAAELEDDDDEDDLDDALTGGAAGLAEARHAPMGERPAPRLDKTVLDVLREEAERELGERKRAREGLETQGELGLTRPTRSKAAPSRVYGEDDPAAPPPIDEDLTPEDERPEEPVSRRKLLPDIEELTSTLEPGRDRDEEEGADEGDEDQRGFRRGLSVVMLIALALVVLYLLAPILGTAVPALAEPLASYTALVDGLRTLVAETLRGLIGG